jgi:hypothetical protein
MVKQQTAIRKFLIKQYGEEQGERYFGRQEQKIFFVRRLLAIL